MKAVYITDMPEDCTRCQFCGFGGTMVELNVCSLTGEYGPQKQLDNCPLKPLPEEEQLNGGYDWRNYALGWNAYRDELIGEEE